MQPKRRFRKSECNSTLSIWRKELREGNLQSLLGGSQHLCNLPVVEPELVSAQPHSIEEAGLTKESSSEDSSHRLYLIPISRDRNIHQSPLSDKEQEDRARRCEFVKGLLLSTFLDDN
ncbi:hypothetical protein RHSIM_Rhsim02G0005700 [Rhododendron simsii]|uniref:Di19 C-terminal domain-containing protein n=1 Tax=Rhododendron simsii TaxID=118357 RepID=A0A834HAS9_RHOSS|nr:hypothetical protein RHSIM_Rhsim02G0005700 [Rhododendron simsii]